MRVRQVGKKYRVAMYLATSSDEDVAEEFMTRLSQPSAGQDPPQQEPTMCVARINTKMHWHALFLALTYGFDRRRRRFIFHFSPTLRCKHVKCATVGISCDAVT